MEEKTVRLTVAYDGTAFAGWQLQPRQRTVQGVLEAALQRLVGEPVRATAAGRTDAGVHAEGQVVSHPLPHGRALPAKAFVQGLNGFLPEDLAVREAAFVPGGFDARRSARGKRYRYLVWNRPTRCPLRRTTHWQLFQRLDSAAMQRAARAFEGEHDFSAFRAADCPAKTTVRRLDLVRIAPREASELEIEVRGTAFLKHMVRNIVGTLVEIGRGKRPEDDVPRLLRGRDRRRAGPTAPAHGLCLMEVYYPGSAP
ncbi:MAG: tRNA pseudouridine(38-40) synthase TruA [Deltaproteobacteria bacterium]